MEPGGARPRPSTAPWRAAGTAPPTATSSPSSPPCAASPAPSPPPRAWPTSGRASWPRPTVWPRPRRHGPAPRPPPRSGCGCAPPASAPRGAGFVVAAGTLAALGVGASVGVAAQTALPGETLYPVKRALEDARTGMTAGERARAELMLADATDRLEETLAVLEAPEAASTAQIPATLGDFSARARGAASLLLDEYAPHRRPRDRRRAAHLHRRQQPRPGAHAATMPDSGLLAWQDAATPWPRSTRTRSRCPLCSADLRSLAADVGLETPDSTRTPWPCPPASPTPTSGPRSGGRPDDGTDGRSSWRRGHTRGARAAGSDPGTSAPTGTATPRRDGAPVEPAARGGPPRRPARR